MDTTFGHQEFLATLSQSSNRSSSKSSTGSTRSHSHSSKKSNSNMLATTTTSQYQQQQFALSSMDEQAVRRLGRKLSLQAHGGGNNSSAAFASIYPPPPPPVVIVSPHPTSGFEAFPVATSATCTVPTSANATNTRTTNNLLQRLTVHCKTLYTQIQTAQQQQEQYHAYSSTSRTGSDSEGYVGSNQQRHHHSNSNTTNTTRQRADSDTAMLDMVHESMRQRRNHTSKGLLSAVLESTTGGGSESTTTATVNSTQNRNPVHTNNNNTTTNRTTGGGDSTASPGTISTKETGYFGTATNERKSSGIANGGAAPDYVRGPCLTEPSAGVANDGCDNADGNLIVHANDLIVVPRKNVRTILRSSSSSCWKTAEFRVHALQGQGTFAQVFSCLHVPSGQMVALKIIKNKSTYTRQAAMEIDIFQSLVVDTTTTSSSSNSHRKGGGGVGVGSNHHKNKQGDSKGKDKNKDSTTTNNDNDNYRDYMVGLKAYFMHLDHLCLVFDLLGMNLYDVLKAREFRGLPLRIVRELARQTVHSIQYFSNKNVVHCDLKPENILMATSDSGKKLMQEGRGDGAGSSRRQYPKRPSGTGGTGGGPCSSSQTMTSHTKSTTTTTDDTDSDKVMGSATASSCSGGSVKSGAAHTTVSDDSSQSQAAKTCVTNESSTSGQGGGDESCSHNNGSQSNAGSGGSSSRKSGGEVISSSSSSTVPMANPAGNMDPASYKIKLIDFGSACFEGHTSHSYIQSRFYRSPEVLIGLPYDSAIDMWSLGCIAAELFLGLPILPGAHEHDQLVRINEMITNIPEWMLEQGSKAKKCYVKYFPNQQQQTAPHASSGSTVASNTAPIPAWRLKTHEEYIVSLSQAEVRKKGGREKLSQPPKNRYFKRKRLSDIILLHAQHEQQNASTTQDGGLLAAFIHFLYGVLDPDPWKRLTALQAAQHPFITGDLTHLRPRQPDLELNPREENQANMLLQIYWAPPWDPTICRRKLQNVQKIRERQNSLRRHNRSSSKSPVVDHSGLHSTDRQRRMASSSYSEQSLCESMATSVQISQQQQHPPYPASPMQMSAATPPIGVSESSSNTSSHMMMSSHATPLGYSASSLGQQQLRPPQQQLQQNQRSMMDGTAGQFQPGMMMAMDSSQVTASYASTEGGDSYSIERPGFFPGSYGVETNSQSSVASYQSGSTHSTSQRNSAFGSYQNRKSSSYGQSMHHHQQQHNGSNYLGSQQHQQHPMAPPQVVIPGQLGDTVSVTSSIAMSEQPAMFDPQQLALFQQQMTFFQQQQQQFGFYPAAVPMQPELQQQQPQPPPMVQQQVMPPSLQQQALPTPPQQPPQQPVMMMQNANGGFYYVTTSATGQPVLLQPVGMWNQQQQLPGPYPGAVATGAPFVPPPPPPYQQPAPPSYPQQQQHSTYPPPQQRGPSSGVGPNNNNP